MSNNAKEAKPLTLAERILAAKIYALSVVKNSKNTHFKNTYADLGEHLAVVAPALAEQGILLTQAVEVREGSSGRYQVVCTKLQAAGETMSSELELPNIQDPQKMGSAITYYRRYTLSALLGLAAEDDDGNAAADSKPQTNGNGGSGYQLKPANGNGTASPKASPKQVNYIKGLMKARFIGDTEAACKAVTKKGLEELTAAGASKLIDLLSDSTNSVWDTIAQFAVEPSDDAGSEGAYND